MNIRRRTEVGKDSQQKVVLLSVRRHLPDLYLCVYPESTQHGLPVHYLAIHVIVARVRCVKQSLLNCCPVIDGVISILIGAPGGAFCVQLLKGYLDIFSLSTTHHRRLAGRQSCLE